MAPQHAPHPLEQAPYPQVASQGWARRRECRLAPWARRPRPRRWCLPPQGRLRPCSQGQGALAWASAGRQVASLLVALLAWCPRRSEAALRLPRVALARGLERPQLPRASEEGPSSSEEAALRLPPMRDLEEQLLVPS